MGLAFYRKKILAVKFRDILMLSLLGFIGMVVHTTFLLIGQGHTTAVNTSLILSLNPVITMLIALFFGHKMNLTKALGMTVSLIGCLMVIGIINSKGVSYNSSHFYGDIMTFISAFFWALYTVLSTKTVSRLGGFTATTWSMIAGALMFLAVKIFWPTTSIIPAYNDTTQWMVILYVVLFPTAAGFYFWYEAMSRIELSLLNIMQYLTPITTILLSYFILNEKMTFFNLIGALLTLFGVMIVANVIRLPLKIKSVKTQAAQP
jgi:drug/metabolite transporter (DMT)-like permease